jgi:hypothetical protein
MIITGVILNIIEKNYDGRFRNVVHLKIGPCVSKSLNNELFIFFNENNLHLLDDFAADDRVFIKCNTLAFAKENNAFYNNIVGQEIRFDVSHYPYYRRKIMGKKFQLNKDKIVCPDGFDYEKMIMDGWTNAGLIEAGYVTKKK